MKPLKKEDNPLTLTYQGILKPNSETKQQLQFISKGCSFVYNWALGKKMKVDKQGKRQPSKEKQTKELTDLKKQKEYKWLNKICAWTLQEVVINRVSDAWKKYEEKKAIYPKANYPREKTDKGWHDSFSVYQDGYQIEGDQILLSQGSWRNKNEPKIVIPFKLNQPLQGKLKTLNISWKHDNWTANFACDIEPPPQLPLSKIKTMNGVDRNYRKLFANSDGWKYKNPKRWEKKLKKIKEFQQSLSRKKHKRNKEDKTKPSNTYLKIKSELKKICQRLSNQVRDRNHKLSKKWVDKNDLTVFEKLKIVEMIKKKDAKGIKRKISKHTADGIMKISWDQQLQFTTYKAKGAGKWVEVVNPYLTSKRCSKCKEINKKLKDEELFECPNPNCNNILDRDVNASRNILEKGIKKLGLGRLGIHTPSFS